MQKKAIFLDRDGVLNAVIIKNGKPYPPSSLEEVVIPTEVLFALNDLKKEGFLLIGATNQPDVARGSTSLSIVESINQYLMQHLPLDEIRMCLHDDTDNCHCRKPLPGLILDAASQHNIDLQKSVMIGDRWKDIAAGQAAGCKTIWLKQDYQEKVPKEPNFIAKNLKEAALWILASTVIFH